MDERNQRNKRIKGLKLAAKSGAIDNLYTLIQEDVKLLEDIDALPFVETPLHTAVSACQIPFAMEMMRLKPSFTRKLNPDGLSPIHLALPYEQTQMVDKEHIRMVRRLLQVDGDLVRVKGKEGKTILHHAAARDDHPYLLAEFLLACPQSIEDVTSHNETALHIALKKNNLQAFQYLVEWLRKSWIKNSKFRERTILNWKDENDDTVLHVAVSKNQPKAVKLLLNCGVDIKDQNLLGKTVMDILKGQPQVANTEIKAQSLIEDMLWCAGASWPPSPCTATSCGAPFLSTVAICGAPFLSTGSCADYLRSAISPIEKLIIFHRRQHTKITDDMRNALLVVAVLIVTVTYQAALSPPGGLWQDNSNPITNVNQYNTSYSPHKAGTLVMGPLNAAIFVLANSVTFYLSISTIFFLIPIDSTSGIVSITLFYLNVCYLASMAAISTSPTTWLLAIFPMSMVAPFFIFYDCVGAFQAAAEMCRAYLCTCRVFFKKVCDFFNGR